MSDATCDHCGRGVPVGGAVVGAVGTYCPGTCRFDAEVLGADPDDLPPLRGRAVAVDN